MLLIALLSMAYKDFLCYAIQHHGLQGSTTHRGLNLHPSVFNQGNFRQIKLQVSLTEELLTEDSILSDISSFG